MADLTALALNAAHQLPVAELHGAVCGLGVCHGDALPIEDVIALLGVDALTDQVSVETFVRAALDELRAEDMTFAPLLPDEEAELGARLEALGQWCSAFLAGIAAGLARLGAASLDDCPEQVREIVRDFAAIAQVDPEDGPARSPESAETDLMEIEEFVKVGALLIMSAFEHDAGDQAR